MLNIQPPLYYNCWQIKLSTTVFIVNNVSLLKPELLYSCYPGWLLICQTQQILAQPK